MITHSDANDDDDPASERYCNVEASLISSSDNSNAELDSQYSQ